MIRALLAALALACVCSPAMAGGGLIVEGLPPTGSFAHGLAFGLLLLGAMALTVVVGLSARVRLPILGVTSAVLLACAIVPALAAEVTTVGGTAAIVPWGEWVIAIAQTVLYALLPILVALLGDAIRKVAPWAMLFLTQARLQQMVTAVTDYALNAVEGAAKGKTLSVPVGSAVIAAGVQYAIENVPARVIAAAGGPEGIARLIFRQLHLEDKAGEANVLAPGLAKAGV
ncbi:hypothetical protein [Methylobacterium tarhaniae]|uniref:hypothetical protein n=1 Tax=Methylobacterium tarhaniae TaxID=1187852 RepID=UPI003CFFC9AD